MKKVTVFTPTFNRGELLKKCYNSLIHQTNKDFVWLIIDDGSNDNTEKIVKKWIDEKKIDINYIKKENGGKHTAYNKALEETSTEYLVVALDSDDYFTEDAIEKIYKNINKTTKNHVGIVCLKIPTINCNDIMCKNYDLKILKNKSLKEALENNLFDSECIFIFKTSYIKNYKYPVFDDEKFFTEAYTYYMMDKPMVWTDDNICICEYQNDGLTKNTIRLFYKYPKSWRLYNKLRMKNNKSFFKRIKYTIYYISFSILGNISIFEDLSWGKVRVVLLYPFGIIGALYIKNKGKF